MELRIWNPFKPHVAKLEVADFYVVRKLTMWGWMYKDISEEFWWLQDSALKYCIHFRPESAAEACYAKKKSFARLYAY